MKKIIESVISAELRFVAFIVIIFMATQLVSFSDYQLSNHYDIEYADFYISKRADYSILESSIESDLAEKGLSENVKPIINREENTIGFKVLASQDSKLMRRITGYIDSIDKNYKTLSRKNMQLSYQYERMYGGSIIWGYLIALFLLSIFWWFKERKNEVALRAIGRVNLRNILFFSIAFIIIHRIAILILSIGADTLGYQSPDYMQTMQSDYYHAPLLFLVLVLVLAPLLEEVLFRGLMYRVFLNNGFPVLGALVVSGMFTLIHGSYSFASQEFKLHDPIYAIAVFTGSLGLCWIYKKYNTLLAPILLHFLYNAVTLGVLIYSIQD